MILRRCLGWLVQTRRDGRGFAQDLSTFRTQVMIEPGSETKVISVTECVTISSIHGHLR